MAEWTQSERTSGRGVSGSARRGAWPTRRGVRGGGWLALLLLLSLVLTACGGGDDDDDPTAPAPSQSDNPNVTVTLATAPASPGGTTPAGGGTPATSGGAPTIGTLADRIASAWTGVTSYRLNEISYPADAPPVATPGATPVAGTPGTMVLDEVVFPDRTHRQIIENGTVVSEILIAENRLFLRGEIVRQFVDPGVDPATWVTIDVTTVDPNTPLGQVLAGFLGSIVAPLGLISPSQRALPVRPAGQTTVEGRTCDVFEITQTTDTGEPVNVTLGLDATGLPCSIETRAGGLVTLATYVAFNETLTIEAPAEFETRDVVATPPAAATPAPGEPTPAG